MRRRRKALAGLCVAAGALTLTELALRWVMPPEEPLAEHAVRPLQLDEDLLWVLEPGEGSVHATRAHINSLGLRGPELEEPKRRRRLLTLGDSSVFGFGVPEGRVLGDVAARDLGLESVNGAMPGYSTEQALAVMERHGERVQPDLVVIAALWSDNNFDGFVDRELRQERRERRAGRRLVWLRQRVRLVRLVSPATKPAAVGFGSLAQSPELGRRRVPLHEYVENLLELARRSRALGAEPLFVVLANDQDVQGVQRVQQWDPYRDAMRRVAASLGCPVVDLPPLARGDQGWLLDQMHPSVGGHRRIGVEVAAVVRGTGWPDRPLCSGEGDDVGPVWDPWQEDPPQGVQPAGSPDLTGVLWTDRPDTSGAVVRVRWAGGMAEQVLPARSAFGFGIDRADATIEVTVRYQDGTTSTVDFGAMHLPARGLFLDLDEGRVGR